MKLRMWQTKGEIGDDDDRETRCGPNTPRWRGGEKRDRGSQKMIVDEIDTHMTGVSYVQGRLRDKIFTSESGEFI